MIVFRLTKSVYKNDLNGRGAEMFGGRWNSKSTPMIYTSQSRALCVAEVAVHTGLGIMPSNYQLITISIPENALIKMVNTDQLPMGWNSFPPLHFTQKLGDAFIKETEFLIMQVPSAVVQGDYNFLVNPVHKEFDKVKIISVEDFNFDKRLFLK